MTSRSARYYAENPEAAAKKVRYQARLNRTPSERRRRALLNAERRRRGIYGKGGKDVSHTTSGGTTLEDPSTNRARNGHGDNPRLRKDAAPRARLTAGMFRPGKGKPCGKSFISGGDSCSKAVQRLFRAARPVDRVTPPPATQATASRYHQHYQQHRRDPQVSNPEIVAMVRSLRDLPGVLPKNVDMASTVIRRTGVELDYDVFSKIYKNDPVEMMKNMSDRYMGIHVARRSLSQITHSPAQSFIYIRPTRPPGTKLAFDAGGAQHQVARTLKKIRVSSITGDYETPEVFSSNRRFNERTQTDESITLIHELGHAVHNRAGYTNPDYVPIRKSVLPFVRLRDRAIRQHPMGYMEVDTNSPAFKADAMRVLTRYGMKTDYDLGRRETFAEGFVVYMTNGEYFRAESPLFYSWVDHIVRTAYTRG